MAFFRRVKKRLQGDDPQQLKRELQWLQTQVGRYKGKILTVGLLSLTGTIMGLISSVASKYLIDAVTGYGADMLWRAVAIMAVMLLGSLVLQGVSSRVGASVHVDVKNEMQHVTYRHVLRAGWEALEPYRSGDLLNRLNSDVNVVSDGIIGFFPSLATSSVKFAGAFAIMLYYDPTMALIALLGVPVTLGLSRMMLRKLRAHNLKIKELPRKAGREVELFNGKDLTGWEAYGTEKWYVDKDGNMVCESGPDKEYGYLATREYYNDFDLTLEFKQLANGNSGVFFRSFVEPPVKVHGWQCEVAPKGFDTAGIYESYGRGWLVQIPDQKENILREGEWNTLRLKVQGDRVQTWLNGEEMVDITDARIGAAQGRIALQIHDGGGIKVLWRNFRLTTL